MFMNTLKWKSSCWRPNHCWLEVMTLKLEQKAAGNGSNHALMANSQTEN